MGWHPLCFGSFQCNGFIGLVNVSDIDITQFSKREKRNIRLERCRVVQNLSNGLR